MHTLATLRSLRIRVTIFSTGGEIPPCFDFYVVRRSYSSRSFLCALDNNIYESVASLQAPRASGAIGKQQEIMSADSFHRAVLSNMAGKLNRRFNACPQLINYMYLNLPLKATPTPGCSVNSWPHSQSWDDALPVEWNLPTMIPLKMAFSGHHK